MPSTLFQEWTRDAKLEGRIETSQDLLVRWLEKKYPKEVTDQHRAAIRSQTNLGILQSWYDATIDNVSFSQFQQLIRA